MTKALSILLVTKKVKLLDRYVLFYLKWVDTLNILKTVAKTSFLIKDDKVLEKYDKMWDVIKNKLNIKFHSKPVYDKKYLKTKVREFDGVIKTNFLGNDTPKENMHYACIACITIDSVMKMDKKNHPQVYLEECKYRVKKIQMSRFISANLESDSESESESESEIESKPDTKSIAKLESNSDSDSD